MGVSKNRGTPKWMIWGCHHLRKHPYILGGDFTPKIWGRWNPFLTDIFSDGLVQPPSNFCRFFESFGLVFCWYVVQYVSSNSCSAQSKLV